MTGTADRIKALLSKWFRNHYTNSACRHTNALAGHLAVNEGVQGPFDKGKSIVRLPGRRS
jgi:hypothetical protein